MKSWKRDKKEIEPWPLINESIPALLLILEYCSELEARVQILEVWKHESMKACKHGGM